MADTSVKFCMRIVGAKDFGKFFLGWLFERFRKGLEVRVALPAPVRLLHRS